MDVMANAIVLVEQVGLLLPSISAVAAYLLAVGDLSCIHATSIVRRLAPSAKTPMSCD